MPSPKSLNLTRKIYNRNDYSNFIDNSFKEIILPEILNSTEDKSFTNPKEKITNFFNQYDKLFYLIPEIGKSNSHEYLVKTSGELVNFNTENDNIILLQNEIGALREDLLESQQELLKTQLENAKFKATLNITDSSSPTIS